jgi:hypothetical protein
VISRFEALVLGWLVRRLVRRQLAPLVEATSKSLLAEIPGASIGTLLSLLLPPQEVLQEATGATEMLAEADEGPDDGGEVSAADSYELAEEVAEVSEPSAEDKRAALAVALRSRPELATPDFAQLLLAARGSGWE